MSIGLNLSGVRIPRSPPKAGIVYWLLPRPSKPMRGVRFSLPAPHYGDSIRPLATLSWELRQVRKEATVPSDACAEVRRVGLPPIS